MAPTSADFDLAAADAFASASASASASSPPPRRRSPLELAALALPAALLLAALAASPAPAAAWLWRALLPAAARAPAPRELEDLGTVLRAAGAAALLLAACWPHAVARRVAAAAVFCWLALLVMAFSASMAWFRNPVTLDHLPDLVQEAFGAALVSVRATLPAAAARLLVAARLGGAEVAVVVVAAAAGNETKATAGPAALAQSQSSSPLAPVVVTFDALRLAETAMAALVFATLAWALTQPWRWLALRRWLAIYGVVALLRAVTVIVTTLPDSRAFCRQTPGTHRLDAFPWAEVLSRALEIAAGRHFETCGDLVFSGHSTVLALVGMALHSYYRVRSGSVSASPLKLATWLLIAALLFVIVATRLHYTLDVLVALFVTIAVFNSYHRLAYDVLVGRRYISFALLDSMLLYPAVAWLEGVHLDEVRAGHGHHALASPLRRVSELGALADPPSPQAEPPPPPLMPRATATAAAAVSASKGVAAITALRLDPPGGAGAGAGARRRRGSTSPR